jgi:hypothetical protein
MAASGHSRRCCVELTALRASGNAHRCHPGVNGGFQGLDRSPIAEHYDSRIGLLPLGSFLK